MKPPRVNSKQGTVFATVILIICLGSGYFLWYLPANQQEVEMKRFRCLQNVAANVDDKIVNSMALLNTLMNNYVNDSAGYTRRKVYNYLKNYSKKNFTLAIDPDDPAPDSNPGKKTQVAEQDTVITYNADMLSIQIIRGNTTIKLTYKLKQFIEGLLPANTFDEYIILTGSDVIYQTFQSGITAMAIDSLKSNKSAYKKTQVRDVSLSGTAYKLFSQQLNIKSPGNNKFTIAGLLTKRKYNTERSSLPSKVVLLLSMITVAAIIVLPWIKLYQMGGQDRMTAADGIYSLAVSMLLMSILFFAFLYYSIPIRTGSYSFKKSAVNIAGSLKLAVGEEIKSRYQTLRKNDSLIHTGTSGEGLDTGFSADIKTKLLPLQQDSSITQILQLYSNGREIRNWSPQQNLSAPPGNYANRDYFKMLQPQNHPLYAENDISKPYGLEPIISRITGDFTTVMSIPSRFRPGTYTCLSFKVRPLQQPVFTPGFTYCIIDPGGKVLYHSNEAKQLNENLFEEFSESTSLASSVHNRTDIFFNTKYEGRQYDVFATPISGLPYTLLVMEDSAFLSVRQVNNFTATFSMLFSYFIILGTELLILFAISIRPSFYKKHYFDVSWMGPNALFREQYNLSFLGNILIIAVLLLFWWKQPPFLEFLFIFIAAAKLCYIFQNYLYLLRYKSLDQKRLKDKQAAAWTMAALLLLLNIFAFHYAPGYRLLVFEIIIGIGLYGLWLFDNQAGLRRFMNGAAGYNLSISFSLMTFTRLIITSGLPVALFFMTVYNYNLRLVSRYRHIEFSNTVLQRAQTIEKIRKLNIYTDKIWIDTTTVLKDTAQFAELTGPQQLTNFIFRNLMISNQQLVPGINDVAIAENDELRRFSCIFYPGKDWSEYKLPGKQHFAAASVPLKYELPLWEKSGDDFNDRFLWFSFMGALAVFFYVFKQILKRLFSMNLPSNAGWSLVDQILLEDNTLNNLVFLIGVPGSGKMEHVMNLVKKGIIKGKGGTDLVYDRHNKANNNCFVADMFLIPNDPTNMKVAEKEWNDMRKAALCDQCKLVIVNQFEYDIKNPESNRSKLSLLEDILQKNNCKVIIISTVHPVNFLDSANQLTDNSQSAPSPGHELERWHVLLGHFRLVIEKLETKTVNFNTKGTWQDTLMYETQRGQLLSAMAGPIKIFSKQLDQQGMNSESLTLKLGVTSHYFYMYIWQSLTKEEKFILYDLAEDGLVNPFDEYNLILLISKGLVIKEQDDILRLFNQGFRDFILTAIGKSEADSIQRQIRDSGNWGKLKIPLTLLIIAAVVFLFTSQREAYSDLIKYVAAIAGGVPLLLQAFNLFKPDSSKITK